MFIEIKRIGSDPQKNGSFQLIKKIDCYRVKWVAESENFDQSRKNNPDQIRNTRIPNQKFSRMNVIIYLVKIW